MYNQAVQIFTCPTALTRTSGDFENFSCPDNITVLLVTLQRHLVHFSVDGNMYTSWKVNLLLCQNHIELATPYFDISPLCRWQRFDALEKMGHIVLYI